VTGTAERPTSGRIEGGRHILPLRIYFEDTDVQGIVYYANWLKFLERGRTELTRLLGFDQSTLRAEGGMNWVVRRCLIDYMKPARFDETIDVITTCGEVRAASVKMIQEAQRAGELLVRAEVLIACTGLDGKPIRVPAEVLAALQAVGGPVDSPRSRHIRI
jgi:acyl-CoA thioester hydrolase